MPPTQETLFLLELVIDYVRFDGSRGNVLDPAVGVRLLDYPTLLIYRSGREDPSKSGCDRQPDDLKYPFQKGKSCLFKINLDSLHTHLLNAPLYAMVLDVKDEIPRLIGSSLISLAEVTGRIKLDVDKHGINAPTAHGERLVSPICNLMGKSIGVISLSYKIVSLGARLIPNIPDNRVPEVGVTPGKEDTPAEVPEIRNALSQQQISLDGQPTDILISEAKQPAVPAYPKTEQARQSVSWSEDPRENTTFCPTPLFYPFNGKDQQERKSFTGLHPAMESLNIEDLEDGNDEEESSDVLEIPEVDRLNKFTSTPKSQPTETDSAPLVDVIRQLPLLNALLAELSQLNVQMPHQQPLSIHPNLAWLYTPEPAGKPKSKTQKTSPKQSSKRIKCVKNAKTDEQKLQPKRRLKYGLTNTFRLRLNLAKSSLSDTHKPASKGVKLPVETVIEKNPKSQIKPSAKKSHDASNSSLREGEKTVHSPRQYLKQSDQHSVSSNISNPGFQSNKVDSRTSSHSHLSNDDNEYQDDFTSRNTTDGDSPDPSKSQTRLSAASNWSLTERDKMVHHPSQYSNRIDQHSVSPNVIIPGFQSNKEDNRTSSRSHLSNEDNEYQADFPSRKTTVGDLPDSKSQTKLSEKKSHDASNWSLNERDKTVHDSRHYSNQSDQHSVSSNISNPGSQSYKEDRSRSCSHLSNDDDEYQDDFTSRETTDRDSPDPLKSETRPSSKKSHDASKWSLTERDKTVHDSVSPNVNNPGFQSNKEDSTSRSHPLLSYEDDEYQDDFTSRNTTVGDLPDPSKSQKRPTAKKRHDASKRSLTERDETVHDSRHYSIQSDQHSVSPNANNQGFQNNKEDGRSRSSPHLSNDDDDEYQDDLPRRNTTVRDSPDPSKSQKRPSAKRSHDASKWSQTKRDITVHESRHYSIQSDQHLVSPNVNNQSFQSNKEDSRSRSRPHLSKDGDEYQDDFTSQKTTDGYSPDPFSSPELDGEKRDRRLKISGSKALSVPAKAENSSHCSLKSTHIIRPRLQTSALIVSSEDSEDELLPRSQSCKRNTPSVRRSFGSELKSQSYDSVSAEKSTTFDRLSEDSNLPTNKPRLKSISLSEEQDKLGSLELDRNCHHISELVINKLPGYTL